MLYHRHASDPAPGVNVQLTSDEILFDPQFYQVQWASDPRLFTAPLGRTESTYYETDLQFGRHKDQFSMLPPEKWDSMRENRSLFVRIGAGDTRDAATDSSWDWTAPEEIRINHDPSANAGAPRRIVVDVNGSTSEDVTLDAGRSTDTDPGTTLEYDWRLSEVAPESTSAFGEPAFEQFVASTRTRLDAAGGATAVPFPTGTVVPPIAEGQYSFELTATDDDPPSMRSGKRGTDTDVVTVTLNGEVTDLEILTPTRESPKRVYRVPDSSDPGVDIEWQIGPGLISELESAVGNYLLRLSLRQHELGGNGDVVYSEFDLVRGRSTGSFTWPLSDVRGASSAPAPRGVYDVLLEIVDMSGNAVSLAGRSTTAEAIAAIDLDRPGLWADQYLETIEVEDNVFRTRLLVSDFDVNSTALRSDHTAALDQVLFNGGDDIVVDEIIGRASQTGPEANNVQLSRGRANAVAQYMIGKGLDPARILSLDGIGSAQPLQDKPGVELDVNRSVEIRLRVAYYLPPKARVPPPAEDPGPQTSYRWAIRLQTSGGGGHKIGVGFAVGEIALLDSNATIDPDDQSSIVAAIQERRHGGFFGFGGGHGLISPGANPWGDWAYFETRSDSGFSQVYRKLDDFDGAFTRLTDAGVGLAFIGYSIAFISFPVLGVNSVSVGGLNTGSVGIAAGVTFGAWRFQ